MVAFAMVHCNKIEFEIFLQLKLRFSFITIELRTSYMYAGHCFANLNRWTPGKLSFDIYFYMKPKFVSFKIRCFEQYSFK